MQPWQIETPHVFEEGDSVRADSSEEFVLTKIRVKNVRLFRGDWTFDLKPLSILCGTNSSGKTTVLKVPLVLKQSAEGQLDSAIDGSLRLGGPTVDMGSFHTFVSDGEPSSSFGIGLEIADRIPRRSLTRLRGNRPRGPVPKKATMVDYQFAAWLEFRDARDAIGPRYRGGLTPRGLPALTRAHFTLAAGGDASMSWQLVRTALDTDEADLKDDFSAWFPQQYIRTVQPPRAKYVGTVKNNRVRYGAHVSGVLPYLLLATRADIADSQEKTTALHIPIPPEADIALTQLRSQLATMQYVGPLRAPARRYYPTDPARGAASDSTGESVPQLLRDQLGRRISYIAPGASKPRRGTLGVACESWFHYLRTGETAPDRGREILVTSVRDFAVEVRVRSSVSSSLHALIDSGFGYSQVLPIVVACLLAEAGSTILIEQPELHLNPALQVRLADFFMAVVRNGRQVILETHSEHLVNAFRVLSVEDETGAFHDQVGITYLDERNGITRKLDLLIRENGTVPEWPPEFFGEALSLTGRLLAAQRRFLSTR